ncbi:hypothetical protein [Paracoccus litorisediminis]|uniref:Uncharacterized protein n=1 Tax=Paracoccus litorisediminis TaxID=2006130 RepID=A0A844HS56_9RHOB|nr:hypothetical protein [Paracoccus litorisediminis]MTH61167.1 hypothetical protein [Paracoccus litorisediminis]
MTLMGKTRYRASRSWFSKPKVILQVLVSDRDHHGDLYAYWKDATIEDLTMLEKQP